jgi:Icc-related predicted phosphoesterase
MVRFLVIGDFHGKFSKKFNFLIKKEKIELIVSVGDYLPFDYRDLWFEHCYGTDVELWEVIGKTKYVELVKKDIEKGEKVLKNLNRLNIPVYTVLGNIDWPDPSDVSDIKKSKKKNILDFDTGKIFVKKLKNYSNIKRFDYGYLRFGDLVFVGMRGHSFPGHVKSKGFRKHKKKLEELFKKFKKENEQGKLIFVSHNVPYNTKLDLVKEEAHKKAKGKHFGSKLAQRIIKKYQPILAVGGHIHEGFGKDKLGNTLLINSGSASEFQGVIIDLSERKVKVKFIK